MPAKTNFTFAPEHDYDNWHDYFTAYAENREAVRNPPIPDAKEGDLRTINTVTPVADEDMPRSAKQLRTYAEDWGYTCEVLSHKRERFFRGAWVPEEVVHVTGVFDGEAHSAFHMRWVNGKAQDCRIQVNGGRKELVGIMLAKKKMQEAR